MHPHRPSVGLTDPASTWRGIVWQPALLLSLVALLPGCVGIIGALAGNAANPPPDDAATTTQDAAVTLVCNDGVHPAHAPLRRLTPNQYANTIDDLFNGVITASTEFPPLGAISTSTTGYSNEPNLNVVTDVAADQIMQAAEDTGIAVAGAVGQLLPCSTQTTPGDTCANTFISTFATRALRRPLLAGESTALMGSFHDMLTAGGSFSDGIAAITTAMLQWPQFLYLPEEGTNNQNGVLTLSDYEIATRLSYLYWDSMPDDTLLAAAGAGMLETPDQIEEQATRMLADPKAQPAITRFFREWTQIQVFGPGGKDPTYFPQFNDALATSIQTGFDQFVMDMVQNQHSLHDLLTTSETEVNATLAAFLGLPATLSSSDTDWVRTNLDPTRYVGLMSQPAVMAGLAHSAETSYVFRGVFLRRQLTCETIPPPPGNAQAVFAALMLSPTASSRTRSTAVNQNSPCNGCHTQIDPPGLAFENFNAIGQYGATDVYGNTVDTSGQSTFGNGTVAIQFSGPVDLMQSLANSGLPEPCLSKQWVRFTFARPDDSADACALQTLVASLSGNTGSLLDMMVAMSTTDAFRYRLTGDTQ